MRERRPVEREQERPEELERELANARENLCKRQQELQEARSAVYERDFKLESVRRELARQESLFESWLETVRQDEQELVEGEAKLIEAELRAERLEESLTAIRSSHAYRLMRMAWRFRRPFRRKRPRS